MHDLLGRLWAADGLTKKDPLPQNGLIYGVSATSEGNISRYRYNVKRVAKNISPFVYVRKMACHHTSIAALSTDDFN